MVALEVTTWQHKHRNATDGHNGGAQRTGWEILLELEKIKFQAGEKDQGAVAQDLELAKAFERVSLPVFWARAI